jgi:hypothetical protein
MNDESLKDDWWLPPDYKDPFNKTKPKDWKSLLNCRGMHNPPFPYFGSVYMTLLSVMNAAILGGIVADIILQKSFNGWEIVKYLPLLTFSRVPHS